VVALKAMDHHEKMHAHEPSLDFRLSTVAALNYSFFGYLARSLDHVDKLLILVDSVAFFEDDRPQSNVGLVQATSCYLEA
jgi:hypothetical protein